MLQFGQTIKRKNKTDKDEEYYKYGLKENGYCFFKFGPDLSATKSEINSGWWIELMDAKHNTIYEEK